MMEWLDTLTEYDLFVLGMAICYLVTISVFWIILTYLNTFTCYTDKQLAIGNRVENLLQLTYISLVINLAFVIIGYLLPYYGSNNHYLNSL